MPPGRALGRCVAARRSWSWFRLRSRCRWGRSRSSRCPLVRAMAASGEAASLPARAARVSAAPRPRSGRRPGCGRRAPTTGTLARRAPVRRAAAARRRSPPRRRRRGAPAPSWPRIPAPATAARTSRRYCCRRAKFNLCLVWRAGLASIEVLVDRRARLADGEHVFLEQLRSDVHVHHRGLRAGVPEQPLERGDPLGVAVAADEPRRERVPEHVRVRELLIDPRRVRVAPDMSAISAERHRRPSSGWLPQGLTCGRPTVTNSGSPGCAGPKCSRRASSHARIARVARGVSGTLRRRRPLPCTCNERSLAPFGSGKLIRASPESARGRGTGGW